MIHSDFLRQVSGRRISSIPKCGILQNTQVTSQGAKVPETVAAMSTPAYRAYVFDEHDHILKAHVVYAETDEEAVAKTTTLVDAHNIEVWEGARLIARLPHSK